MGTAQIPDRNAATDRSIMDGVQDIPLTEDKRTADDVAVQEALRRRGPLPQHVAIIMDGNGRWAKQRGQKRVQGHRQGVGSVRDVTEACAELGIGHLTLYTFSTENWKRPITEVDALMHLLIYSIERERETLLKNRIRLHAVGDLSRLPRACRKALDAAMADTAGGDRMTLTLALSYSGRWDILHAAHEMARRVQQGAVALDACDEAYFAGLLATRSMPDPDLVIRTGGEYRISNFLLWQMAYSELFITEAFWPDFRRNLLYEAIMSYQDRDRRFGGVRA